MKWSQASSGAAGDHLCQAASTIISGVASMPEQGENEKDACVAFLLSLKNANNASLGSSYKCCAQGLMTLACCAYNSSVSVTCNGAVW